MIAMTGPHLRIDIGTRSPAEAARVRAAMVVADNVANSNMGTALEYAYRWYGVCLFVSGSDAHVSC